MDDKIAEDLKQVRQELQALEKELLEYRRNIDAYRAPKELDAWQVASALALSEGRYSQPEDRKAELLAKKRRLEDLAAIYERQDLETVWRTASYRSL